MTMKRLLSLFLLSCISVFILSACSNHKTGLTAEQNDKLRVVTTYSIIYDITKNIAGNLVEVHSLSPAGANPHEYDPLPLDVQKTTDADLVFYNGLNLEAGNSWFENLIETTGKSVQDETVIRVSERVKPMYLKSKRDQEEDPHAWLDLKNGIIYTENIRNALVKADPDHKQVYVSNAKKYIDDLQALEEEALIRFNAIPPQERNFVTSEGAFKYFSEAYDVNAEYIWEINQENEGMPDQVTKIVDTVKNKHIKALLLETSVDARSMEMVSRETNLPIVGKVFTDSLGKPGEDGDTYLKMMEWNINTIADAIKNK